MGLGSYILHSFITAWVFGREFSDRTASELMAISILNLMLMPFVALLVSIGRGYLPALGWAILTLIGAQIISILGWGDILPWSVPVLLSGIFGPQGVAQLGTHSYLLVFWLPF